MIAAFPLFVPERTNVSRLTPPMGLTQGTYGHVNVRTDVGDAPPDLPQAWVTRLNTLQPLACDPQTMWFKQQDKWHLLLSVAREKSLLPGRYRVWLDAVRHPRILEVRDHPAYYEADESQVSGRASIVPGTLRFVIPGTHSIPPLCSLMRTSDSTPYSGTWNVSSTGGEWVLTFSDPTAHALTLFWVSGLRSGMEP